MGEEVSSQSNNKRIAKNTMLLYLRMLAMLVASLYTSRIVLDTLGVKDFGLYNIIGGVIILFSFLNSAMSSATQRFLNYEIGKNDKAQLQRIFNASISIHVLIGIIILFFAETVGLWFVNYKLNIPTDRVYAANWVYQFTIITFLISVIRVPYNAAIIAHEKMNFYAYISTIEVVMKLLIVYLIVMFPIDKLVLYAFLITVVTFIVSSVYVIYCKTKLSITKYVFFIDKVLYKDLLSFSGWSLLGGIANIGKTQGVNVILNIFYGVGINAAMGITNQVSSTLNNFVYNFQLASSPQIVKYYASNELSNLVNLIIRTSKYSFYLLYILSFPVLLNIDLLLHSWLKVVPDNTPLFCQLTIVYLMMETISGPLWMSMQATGQIKKYQILVSFVLLLNLPISYSLLYFGYEAFSVLLVNVVLSVAAFGVRLFFVKKSIKDFSVIIFFSRVLFPIAILACVSVPILFFPFFKANTLMAFFRNTLFVELYIIVVIILSLDKLDRDSLAKNFRKLIKK